MPVIRRRDGDRVDILVLEQLADVAVRLGFWQTHLVEFGEALIENVFVHVAKRGDLRLLDLRVALDVVIAAPAHAADRHAHAVIRAEDATACAKSSAACGERSTRRNCRASRLEKFPPLDRHKIPRSI